MRDGRLSVLPTASRREAHDPVRQPGAVIEEHVSFPIPLTVYPSLVPLNPTWVSSRNVP